jgi:hypothetical protein
MKRIEVAADGTLLPSPQRQPPLEEDYSASPEHAQPQPPPAQLQELAVPEEGAPQEPAPAAGT